MAEHQYLVCPGCDHLKIKYVTSPELRCQRCLQDPLCWDCPNTENMYCPGPGCVYRREPGTALPTLWDHLMDDAGRDVT